METIKLVTIVTPQYGAPYAKRTFRLMPHITVHGTLLHKQKDNYWCPQKDAPTAHVPHTYNTTHALTTCPVSFIQENGTILGYVMAKQPRTPHDNDSK